MFYYGLLMVVAPISAIITMLTLDPAIYSGASFFGCVTFLTCVGMIIGTGIRLIATGGF